jgi:hypothetical protein
MKLKIIKAPARKFRSRLSGNASTARMLQNPISELGLTYS